MIYHYGPFGVKVFFVISGYLITTLLLNEERKSGRISIKMFYVRRAFRIWPVAYTFILVAAILSWSGWITLGPHNLIYAVTFTMNHDLNGSWWTGHLWSLGVEEQFYLVWPLIFLFTSKRGRLWTCLFVLAGAPLLRLTAYLYAPHIFAAMEESLLFMSDAIAIGCLLAITTSELESSPTVRRIISVRWFFLVPLLSVAMYATLKPFPAFYLGVGESVALVCIAATIWRVIHIEDAAFWLLNTKPLVTIGILSYSLYIWQQLFLTPNSNNVINRLPLNLILIGGVSAFSYYFVETPFLRLRTSLSKRWQRRAQGEERGQSLTPVLVSEKKQ